MTHDEAVATLQALLASAPTDEDGMCGWIPEAHRQADAILLRFLRANGAACVADAYEAVEGHEGFWYD